MVTLNAPPVVLGIDFSDHWSFNKFGYRAFMVTDTAFYRNPNYHAPTDLPRPWILRVWPRLWRD